MPRLRTFLCGVLLMALALPGQGAAFGPQPYGPAGGSPFGAPATDPFGSSSFRPSGSAPTGQVVAGLQDVIDTVELSFRPGSTGWPPVEDMTADFFQRSTLAAKNNREFRSDGQVALKFASANEPLKFRFTYNRPTTQEIVCDGRVLWVYLRENNQVIISDVSQAFNPHRYNPTRDRATNFLQGLGAIAKDFQIVFSPQMYDPVGNYILEMTPRRSSVTIAKLYMVVSRDAVSRRVALRPGRRDPGLASLEVLFPILSTTVIDPDGNSTTMEFSNIRTNTRLPDIVFNFVVPPTAQVLKPPAGP